MYEFDTEAGNVDYSEAKETSSNLHQPSAIRKAFVIKNPFVEKQNRVRGSQMPKLRDTVLAFK